MRSLSRGLLVLLIAACLVAVCFVAAPASAKQAMITKNDGSTMTGEVVSESATEVVLSISGIRTTVPTADIKSIEYLKSIDEQYRERRALIPDNDLEARTRLVTWLKDQHAYDLALGEVNSILKADPNNSDAKTLKAIIESSKAASSGTGTPKPPVKTGTTTKPVVTTGIKTLSDEQINIIRVFEVDLNAKPPPPVVIPRDVLDAILSKYSAEEGLPKGSVEQERFRGLQGYEQLGIIFQALGEKARPYYGKIKMNRDPESITNFRRTYYNSYVVNYCGNAGCHGGERAGQFQLIADHPYDDKTFYTNLYILKASKFKDGWVMDPDYPERSLLVQYALPRTNALTPHPDVVDWHSQLTGEKDPAYAPMLDWVRNGLRKGPYPMIDYKLPSAGPSTTTTTQKAPPKVTGTPPRTGNNPRPPLPNK